MELDSERSDAMRRRMTLGLVGAVALLVALAAPVSAGGWAVTTFGDVPAEFQAGTTYQLDYSVRQHGQHLVDPGETSIRIWNGETGEEHIFTGQSSGETGYYTAEVTFPSAGEWQWEVIQGMFGPQELGSLSVAGADAASGATNDGTFWTSSAARVGLPVAMVAMLALFGLQLFWFRRDRQMAASVPGATPAGAGD
jgi:hypothetical protein